MILQILFLLSLAITTTSSPFSFDKPVKGRTCGTPEPDDALRGYHSHLHHHEPRDNHLWNKTLIEDHVQKYHPKGKRSLDLRDLSNPYKLSKRQTPVEPLFTIDTYFHIVSDAQSNDPNSISHVRSQMVRDQFAYISNSYAGTGIGFNLKDVTFTVNDTWASNGDDIGMKTALRNGTYSALNIYYQTLLQTNGDNGTEAGAILLGFCCTVV